MQSPKPSVEAIFKKLDPQGTGMLTKHGVKQALAEMGLDSSEGAVEAIFKAAPMTSPKTFIGKLKQEKASTDAASMGMMKQRHEQELVQERLRHQQEMSELARAKDAQTKALVSSTSPGRFGYGSPGALVPASNLASPESLAAKSPSSGYKMVTRATPAKSSYLNAGADPNPTGFLSPVTYNRKFNQLVADMEVQTQIKVEEALREQRDRHADALERVVAEKDSEMALRLSELNRHLESQHNRELHENLTLVSKQAEEQRLSLLNSESAKMEELLGEAEMYKIRSEAELVDANAKFKDILAKQLEDQRRSLTEELRRSVQEAESRATELRLSVVEEKDKQFAAEKDALETRLRAASAAEAELQLKRVEAKMTEELAKQAANLAEEHERDKEEALLDLATQHTNKVENVESSLRLKHGESVRETLTKASADWETQREKIRLSLAQEHADELTRALQAKEAEHLSKLEALADRMHSEHRAQLSDQVAAKDREHGEQLRHQMRILEEQHTTTLEMQLEAKEATHARVLEQALNQRDQEQKKILSAALREQESHHVERTQLLLAQTSDAGRSRTEELVKDRDTNHSEHMVKVKTELAACHQDNLVRELAHQREQLRRQFEAEKHEVTARLEEKRITEVAQINMDHDHKVEELKKELESAHAQAKSDLEQEWATKREDAVKVSARNLHDMSQEALRRSLLEKDRETADALERQAMEKDSFHAEMMQQMASQRDEEWNDRLAAELEAVEQEHKAVMDQLVKEKLDADKLGRDQILDLKEHISQLETKMHINKTSASLDVRRQGERLGKFMAWVADQKIHVAVETSLGYFKSGVIKVLDEDTGTASVLFEDGTSESEVSLARIAFKPLEAAPPPPQLPPSGKAQEVDLSGVLGSMSSAERTLIVFLPLAVFPVVVAALTALLGLAYSSP